MKKILILTYYYKHKNAMASVRAIKLAKYFSKQGYEVSVLTSSQIDTWTKKYLTPIKDENIHEMYAPQIKRWTIIRHYLDYRKKRGEARQNSIQYDNNHSIQSVYVQSDCLKRKFVSYLKWQFYFNLAKQEDICMFKGMKKLFRKEKLSKYDTVIATYPTYGAFLMGIWLKKNGLCKQLIADFRDPLFNPGFRSRKKEANYDLRCLKKILNNSDRVVCVSEGIADGIRQNVPEFQKPINIITNGYDVDDVFLNNTDVNYDENKLHFVYTGTLYHGKRCVDMLASVLEELISEEKISINDFTFEYAGPDFEELINQLKEYDLETTAINHGHVMRETSIAMQKKADALLLLTWNEKKYQGVVPGKLFEYMATGDIPIIALVTGDVINSEVSKIIRDSKSGCVCEEASPRDRLILKEYIIRLFNNELQYQSEVNKYNYENICKEYIKLM